jgi:2-polyprenyl-3-methyl-5-hydroxy-6-metoxy-1,4-benzoquinol methylase
VQTCPACGGPLIDWRSVPSSEPALGERRFELRRCLSCGSAVTVGDPVPESHDTGAYRAGQPRLYRIARPILGAFDRHRLRLVRELAAPRARLLDAGAGRGRFVVSARAAGYDAFGIEPSSRGAEAAAAIGATVQRASLETAEIAERSVDVATVWHVLEHLDDPGEAVARLHAWVRPDGGLLVGVPNLASLQARLGGERWYHLDVPRHRVHFTPAGIHALLRGHGFEVVRTDHLLLEHNPFGMWQSLVNRLTTNPSYLYNLLKRNAPMRSRDLAITGVAVALAPFAAALELGAAVAGRGGTIAVLARRTA